MTKIKRVLADRWYDPVWAAMFAGGVIGVVVSLEWPHETAAFLCRTVGVC